MQARRYSLGKSQRYRLGSISPTVRSLLRFGCFVLGDADLMVGGSSSVLARASRTSHRPTRPRARGASSTRSSSKSRSEIRTLRRRGRTTSLLLCSLHGRNLLLQVLRRGICCRSLPSRPRRRAMRTRTCTPKRRRLDRRRRRASLRPRLMWRLRVESRWISSMYRSTSRSRRYDLARRRVSARVLPLTTIYISATSTSTSTPAKRIELNQNQLKHTQ